MDPLPPRRIVLESLAGRRGERALFENLTLELGPGEAAELRGPNGAGKTTLLMILAGIVRAAAGTARLEGGDPEGRPETDIAYMSHRPAIKPRLTVTENLKFWVALNGGDADIDAALETVGLGPIAWLQAGHLSAGQTRRLALARLLLADRPVWLMDEPTSALDSDGEKLVARLIDHHLDRGGLVVAATHHDLGLAHAVRRIEIGRARAAA
ncbi:MAG TPA: heme ABC exporter ATP-binding protein CcmA [Devosia sp.]|nr:heme ABC exporter ATP-binding protein CcmA [Devosia sp.]